MGAASLLLADARFPAGGHAHSGGVETAATAGTVTDLASLEAFLRGRLRTAGLTAAGLAAAGSVAALVGTTEEMCATLERRREELGISYLMVGDELMEAFAPVVERLASR